MRLQNDVSIDMFFFVLVVFMEFFLWNESNHRNIFDGLYPNYSIFVFVLQIFERISKKVWSNFLKY